MSEREKRLVLIDSELAGERVDVALSKVLEISRSATADLLNAGDVKQGKKLLSKSDRVEVGDRIEVTMPALIDPLDFTKVVSDEITIIYDDEDVVVVDKPVGTAAHPSPGWKGPTVLGDLVAKGFRISTSGAEERKGIVQRLDVGTTGLMMVAKNEAAYLNLKDQFRSRKVSKIYHALVQGHMDPVTGTIDAPIDRHPKEDHRFAVIAEGKESITHYEVIEFYRSVSLVKVELETGRTHQIRVHFSALNHPLVGDTTYGADPVLGKSLKMSRPWLHALELRFAHPVTKEQLVFNAPYAPDLETCLGLLSDAVLP